MRELSSEGEEKSSPVFRMCRLFVVVFVIDPVLDTCHSISTKLIGHIGERETGCTWVWRLSVVSRTCK